MRFVDSNIFLHALLKPRRELTSDEAEIKAAAKSIIKKIEGGEPVALSVVHFSEVINVVETGLGLREALGLAQWLLASNNVRILPVEEGDYEEALPVAEQRAVSLNDALAYVLAKREGINEIYSFDKHFDNLDMKRLVSNSPA